MQLGFNAAQFEPTMGMDPWPDGWVPVILSTIDGKQTTSGGGQLGCVLQAIDGPLKGKQQYLGLNLWHSNPQTVEIANKTLSAITYVTIGANKGTIQFNDTNELCNIPFLVLASRQKDDPSRNEFRAFRDIRGNDPKGQPPAQPIVLAGTVGSGSPAPHAPAGAPAGFAPPGGPAAAPAFAPPPQAAPAPSFAPPGGPAPAAAPAWAGAVPAAPAAAAAAPAWAGAAPAGAPVPAAPPPAAAPSWAPPGGTVAAAPNAAPAWAVR